MNEAQAMNMNPNKQQKMWPHRTPAHDKHQPANGPAYISSLIIIITSSDSSRRPHPTHRKQAKPSPNGLLGRYRVESGRVCTPTTEPTPEATPPASVTALHPVQTLAQHTRLASSTYCVQTCTRTRYRRNAAAAAGSAPIKLLGKNAQTVPTADKTKDSAMTAEANIFSLAESSWPKSLR